MKNLSSSLGFFAGIIPGMFGGNEESSASPTIINPPAPISAARSPEARSPQKRSAPSLASGSALPPPTSGGRGGKSLLGQ